MIISLFILVILLSLVSNVIRKPVNNIIAYITSTHNKYFPSGRI
jgi:hypothetical protein